MGAPQRLSGNQQQRRRRRFGHRRLRAAGPARLRPDAGADPGRVRARRHHPAANAARQRPGAGRLRTARQVPLQLLREPVQLQVQARQGEVEEVPQPLQADRQARQAPVQGASDRPLRQRRPDAGALRLAGEAGRLTLPSVSSTERVHVTRSRAKPGGRAAGTEGTVPFKRARKPPWLKVPAPGGPNYRRLKEKIGADNLHTVCEEANCPNVGECWERGTATFMILGDVCTRRCGFCNVQTGKPTWNDPLEPLRVANQVKAMGLRHAVVTSVDRDDLPDYGASAFVGVIRSIRMLAPDCKVEILTPDFRGQEMPLAKVVHEKPDVFNHNVETVPRLYPVARRGSRFARSARVLKMAKEMGGDDVVTKSGLMVGLGESFEEMVETFGILREHRVQILTVGQYLRPTENHLPVVRYWHPDEFAALEQAAYDLGFESVAAGPLVRSSYHADQNLPESHRAESLLAS